MMLPDLNPFLAIAERLSREAGLRLKANAIRRINSQDAFDVKLQEDVDTERVIRAALTAETPFPVLGEEEGGATNFFCFRFGLNPLLGCGSYRWYLQLFAPLSGNLCEYWLDDGSRAFAWRYL